MIYNRSTNKKKKELDEQKKSYEEKINDLKETHKLEISSLTSQFKNKEKNMNLQISRLANEISSLRSELKDQKDKLAKAQALHPEFNFEEEINKMVEDEFRSAALSIDTKLEKTLELVADKDRVNIFEEAIRVYENASFEVKKYIKSDIEKLQELYEESNSLRKEYIKAEQERRDRAEAEDAYARIRSIFDENLEGNHKTYRALKEAYSMYERLTSSQKCFFTDKELLRNLTRTLSEAEEDYNNIQKAHEAENKVSSIIDGIYSANENDRPDLDRAMRIYRSLTTAQAVYFNKEILQRQRLLLEEAERDHRWKEDERRRRRQQPHHNGDPDFRGMSHHNDDLGFRGPSHHNSLSARSSTHHSSSPTHRPSSHNSGHGGRPSGGGAKRGF